MFRLVRFVAVDGAAVKISDFLPIGHDEGVCALSQFARRTLVLSKMIIAYCASHHALVNGYSQEHLHKLARFVKWNEATDDCKIRYALNPFMLCLFRKTPDLALQP